MSCRISIFHSTQIFKHFFADVPADSICSVNEGNTGKKDKPSEEEKLINLGVGTAKQIQSETTEEEKHYPKVLTAPQWYEFKEKLANLAVTI